MKIIKYFTQKEKTREVEESIQDVTSSQIQEDKFVLLNDKMNYSEKRRKPSSRSTSEKRQRCHTLETLPPEVLEMILRYLPYHEIANSVRLVSKKCLAVATMILNGAFVSTGARLQTIMLHLDRGTQEADNVRDLAIRSRALHRLEFVKAQYELLRAVVWRYTQPVKSQPKFARLCFYGGIILDELDALLRAARTNPEMLFGNDKPAQRITRFSVICKKFVNYFEKISELKINNKHTLVSGCKPIDILDCLLSGREVLNFHVLPGRGRRASSVSMRLRYVLERTWFTCLEVPGSIAEEEKNSWSNEQRFMYLRLWRLVNSVNEHYLEKLHYQKELLLEDSDFFSPPKPPPCSTYSGYGEYAGRFFYYGNMNEYAFDSKVLDSWRINSIRDKKRKRIPEKPCYDLIINVDLKCSLDLAPLAVRSMLNCDNFESKHCETSHRPEMYLKLNISCPASLSNKLPSNFVWELRSPRRYRLN